MDFYFMKNYTFISDIYIDGKIVYSLPDDELTINYIFISKHQALFSDLQKYVKNIKASNITFMFTEGSLAREFIISDYGQTTELIMNSYS